MIGPRMEVDPTAIFAHASNPTSKCQTQLTPAFSNSLLFPFHIPSSLPSISISLSLYIPSIHTLTFSHSHHPPLHTFHLMRAFTYRFSLFNWRSSSLTTPSPFSSISPTITMSEPHQSSVFETPRLVLKKVLAKSQHEGDGAVVRRGIGRSELKSLDPFLMLDDFSVSPPSGFPDHPHRGFETVTYMLQGAITHQDFAGHKGTIRTGDVQWMTAGRGIIHSEMPGGEGTHKGLQLWINLSSKDKMIEPNYQELLKEDIPVAEQDGVEVRVIAGESMGVHSPVYTRTPTMFLDFSLSPGAEFHQNIPESWNAFVYVVEGEGIFGCPSSSPVVAHHVLVLSLGDGLSVWNRSSKPLRFALIAGQPLNEPVAQYGPFVMNTQSEIEKTIEDYQYCKNGFEMGKYWRSQ